MTIYGDGSGEMNSVRSSAFFGCSGQQNKNWFSWMQHGRSSVRTSRFHESLSLPKDHINARGHACSLYDAAMSRENQPDHAPYSVYSHREKWFLVAIISFAGLFRCVVE